MANCFFADVFMTVAILEGKPNTVPTINMQEMKHRRFFLPEDNEETMSKSIAETNPITLEELQERGLQEGDFKSMFGLMRDSNAGVSQLVYRRQSDDVPIQAVLFVDGEGSCKEILSAVDETTEDW